MSEIATIQNASDRGYNPHLSLGQDYRQLIIRQWMENGSFGTYDAFQPGKYALNEFIEFADIPSAYEMNQLKLYNIYSTVSFGGSPSNINWSSNINTITIVNSAPVGSYSTLSLMFRISSEGSTIHQPFNSWSWVQGTAISGISGINGTLNLKGISSPTAFTLEVRFIKTSSISFNLKLLKYTYSKGSKEIWLNLKI